MKRIVPIVLWVLVALLAACTPSVEASRCLEGPIQRLAAIDSVMQQRPDSALALLLDCRDGVHTVSTDPTDRHYYQLLLSEALYKNDSTQANRKALQQAMAYFDSLSLTLSDTPHAFWSHCGPSFRECGTQSPEQNDNLIFLTARSHYMNGVGYYENDSAVPACQEYMKALDIMQDHFEEKELVGYMAKFMALTYTRLTDVYSDLYLHEQAIFFTRLSLPYYQKHNAPPWHLARMFGEIGTYYEMMKQWDNAEFYYQRAITYLSDTNLLIYRDISALQAYLKYEITSQSNLSLIELNCLLSQAENEREIMARSLSIGEIYYHEKQFDSASVYLQEVFRGNARTDSKKQAAEWLVEICKAQGREADIMEYADFLVPFANKEENQSTIKSQLTELYNAFRQGVSERQHQRIARKNARWTAVAICGLLFIILSIAWLYHKNKKKLQYIESQKPEEAAKAQDRLLAFMEEPVCQEIIHSVQGQNIKRMATPKDYPDLVMSEEQLQQLAFMVNRYFGPFEYHLEQHGVKASPIMSSLCHLFLLGIDEKQAAILLDRDYSSISRYVKKLKTAFGTQESLSVYFRNLVLNN